MEIVVVGRHTEITDRFRRHVEDKLTKVEQLAPTARRIDVEVTHEKNPRLVEVRERVELTVQDKGPVVRAEAAADDRLHALDLATARLMERLRRSRDRKKDHRHHLTHPLADPLADLPSGLPAAPPAESSDVAEPEAPSVAEDEMVLGDSPVVIRRKVHQATPMNIDDALYEMELVGHDFYLFVDAESNRPSVVYRRRGWSYGVIALDTGPVDVS